MRSSKHLKATPLTSEEFLRDQLSKDRTRDTLEDILKHFEDTNLTVTETSHDTQTANRRASNQCNNGTNCDYTLSPDKPNPRTLTQQWTIK